MTRLQKQLLTAEVRGSREAVEALLAAPSTVEGAGFDGTVFEPDLVQLRAPRVRRTSLRRRTDGSWRVLHHQGTPHQGVPAAHE